MSILPPMSSLSGAELIKARAASLPDKPGVYRMLDAQGKALYVGKAKNLKKRVVSYTQSARLDRRLQRMVELTMGMEFVLTVTEAEALLLEANLIKQLMPRYNILLRDDKSYPYIRVSLDHNYPRISKYRGTRKPSAEYFGPFASAGAVNQALATLQKAFLLRPCTDTYFAARLRPCLQYQIKRCSAPCVEKISEAAYAELIEEARQFLTGKSAEIQKRLSTEMEAASEAMDYERAAGLRDRIRALTQVQTTQRLHLPGIIDADIIALSRTGSESCIQVFFFRSGQNYGNRSFFPRHEEDSSDAAILSAFLGQFYQNHPAPSLVLLSSVPDEQALIEEALSQKEGKRVSLHVPERGDKRKAVEFAIRNAEDALRRHRTETATNNELLEQLRVLFDLSAQPNRIEVYDNSHIMGTGSMGAMITAGPEGFITSAYRKFTIRGTKAVEGEEAAITPGDDYAMLKEVLSRRFKPGSNREEWPELLLIDGGKGQLSAACDALKLLDIALPVVAISKGPDRNAGREQFHMPGRETFTLPPGDPVLHYLQRLRDEAHRFAIGAHRKKRTKAMTQSVLDSIPGIGPRRRKALLHHFGSVKGLEQATVEDLLKVEGIHRAMAETIHGYFHEGGK